MTVKETDRKQIKALTRSVCLAGGRRPGHFLLQTEEEKCRRWGKIVETPRRATPTTCFNTWAVERVQTLTRTKETQIMIIIEACYQFKAHKSVGLYKHEYLHMESFPSDKEFFG